MNGSGAVSLAAGLSSLQSAQTALQLQVGTQRNALDIQQQLVEQLLAQLLAQVGVGANLNIQA